MLGENLVTDLALAINNNPLLTELNLSDNVLSKSLIEIAKACKTRKYFTSLDMHCNCIDPSVVPDLAQVVGTINTLEILFMVKCQCKVY